MKTTAQLKDIRKMSVEEINKKIADLKEELFNIRDQTKNLNILEAIL